MRRKGAKAEHAEMTGDDGTGEMSSQCLSLGPTEESLSKREMDG